jgi:hypothetical protein
VGTYLNGEPHGMQLIINGVVAGGGRSQGSWEEEQEMSKRVRAQRLGDEEGGTHTTCFFDNGFLLAGSADCIGAFGQDAGAAAASAGNIAAATDGQIVSVFDRSNGGAGVAGAGIPKPLIPEMIRNSNSELT